MQMPFPWRPFWVVLPVACAFGTDAKGLVRREFHAIEIQPYGDFQGNRDGRNGVIDDSHGEAADVASFKEENVEASRQKGTSGMISELTYRLAAIFSAVSNVLNTFRQEELLIESLLKRAEAECTEDSIQALKMTAKWSKYYALSDIVSNISPGVKQLDWICGNGTTPAALPDSLACAFHSLQPSGNESPFSRLFRVVQQRLTSTSNLAPKEAIVVHVRIGDVVDDSKDSVYNMLRSQTFFYDFAPWQDWNAYVKPLNHFVELEKLASTGQAVVLVASAHGEDESRPLKSCQYLHAVSNFFQDKGHPVTLRTGHTPDSDVLYVSSSSFFAPTGGGFSRLLGSLAKRRGGTILLTDYVKLT
jgi:hypothetical protein